MHWPVSNNPIPDIPKDEIQLWDDPTSQHLMIDDS